MHFHFVTGLDRVSFRHPAPLAVQVAILSPPLQGQLLNLSAATARLARRAQRRSARPPAGDEKRVVDREFVSY